MILPGQLLDVLDFIWKFHYHTNFKAIFLFRSIKRHNVVPRNTTKYVSNKKPNSLFAIWAKKVHQGAVQK